jgi:hypothetical protein
MSDPTPGADPVVTCPSCQGYMRRLPLDGLYGTRLAIDLCPVCQGFWFDGREHLQLAPGAILQLFEIIHDANGPRTPLPARLPCPRCGLRLLLTDDRQRATRFRYWRCAREHGRYITFVDFLREKDFVRELDPAQLAELKAQVRSVSCSSCGAPIDLARDTVCSHCHTPLAMLDVEQVGRVVDQLRQAAEHTAHPDPTKAAALGLALLRERQQVESQFRQLETPHWDALNASGGLVEGGLSEVVALIRRLRSS